MADSKSLRVIEAGASERRQGSGYVGFFSIPYDDENVIELSRRIMEEDTYDTLTRIFDGTRFVATNVFFTQEKSHFEPTSRFPHDWHRYEFICDRFTQP